MKKPLKTATIALTALLVATLFISMAKSQVPPIPMTIDGYVLIRRIDGTSITVPAGFAVYAKEGTKIINAEDPQKKWITDLNGYFKLGASASSDGVPIDLWVETINVTRIIFRQGTFLTLNLTVIDTKPPEISNPYQNPPGQKVQPGKVVEVEPGFNIIVKVNVTEFCIEKVSLHYNVSATQWMEIQMTRTTGNEYTATIPSSSYPPQTTIHYYIKAVDKAGNTAQTPEADVYFISYIIPEYQKIKLIILLPIIALAIALMKKWKKNSPYQSPIF
ncbi:MAG: hypothetical protein QXZ68_03705 [Candidatus Bathyarchaeia archaeon]